MKTMNREQAANEGYINLLLDGSRGIYIPQTFAQSFVVREAELDDDMAICAAGPDDPLYWEAWENIVDAGTIEGESGRVWTLYTEDGDLFAVDAAAAGNIIWED